VVGSAGLELIHGLSNGEFMCHNLQWISQRIIEIRRDFDRLYTLQTDSCNKQEIFELKSKFLGKKGFVTKLFPEITKLSRDQRSSAGQLINEFRLEVSNKIGHLETRFHNWVVKSSLQEKRVDVSLPMDGGWEYRGSLHPLTVTRRIILDEFYRMGFSLYDGPEIEFDFYNFAALNFPKNHPARDMQDTFYIEGHDDLVLRTHTSNLQIHCMQECSPPLRIVAPGRVFRYDSDTTHTPMFHQIEAIVVDKGVCFSHLKGTIDRFMKALFGKKMVTRFRPSYFPFVEPGAELDLQCVLCSGRGCHLCKDTGWLEVGGCGMIHPNVFKNLHYDHEDFSGFAFGFGIDRMAMLKFKLVDLRQMFRGDVDFLSQFSICT